MGLAMIRDDLSIVAVKDGYQAPRKSGEGATPHLAALLPLGRGSVDWHRALSLLGEMGYDAGGPHGTPRLDSTARGDAVYLRRVLADKPALQWRGRDDE